MTGAFKEKASRPRLRACWASSSERTSRGGTPRISPAENPASQAALSELRSERWAPRAALIELAQWKRMEKSIMNNTTRPKSFIVIRSLILAALVTAVLGAVPSAASASAVPGGLTRANFVVGLSP